MNDHLRSIFLGSAGLSVALVAALVLTVFRRRLDSSPGSRERTVDLFLIGLSAQSLHFMEEFITGFQYKFPALLGLSAWPTAFFVAFNLIWLSLWILSAAGLRRGYRLALFPIWFFALASVANGIAHPVLAALAHGYFPGLITSPVIGVLGVMLCQRLLALTRSPHKLAS